jgi:hypothetical protein
MPLPLSTDGQTPEEYSKWLQFKNHDLQLISLEKQSSEFLGHVVLNFTAYQDYLLLQQPEKIYSETLYQILENLYTGVTIKTILRIRGQYGKVKKHWGVKGLTIDD